MIKGGPSIIIDSRHATVNACLTHFNIMWFLHCTIKKSWKIWNDAKMCRVDTSKMRCLAAEELLYSTRIGQL